MTYSLHSPAIGAAAQGCVPACSRIAPMPNIDGSLYILQAATTSTHPSMLAMSHCTMCGDFSSPLDLVFAMRSK
eukprot:20533-Heterococcus_DN1.PRE.2